MYLKNAVGLGMSPRHVHFPALLASNCILGPDIRRPVRCFARKRVFLGARVGRLFSSALLIADDGLRQLCAGIRSGEMQDTSMRHATLIARKRCHGSEVDTAHQCQAAMASFAGPLVRIHLPPAKSLRTTGSAVDHGERRVLPAASTASRCYTISRSRTRGSL